MREDGKSVPLGSTAVKLLLALVERAGSIVTKDDLISRAWGYADVSESTLYVHINALRKTVGKDLIVTKQGRGYRFNAQVERSNKQMRGAPARVCGNLPSLWTVAHGPGRLIGRDSQLQTLSRILSQTRLVTLIGPGGVGKTRIAVQAAGERASKFADGAWLVELATLANPDLVPSAVAAALGLKIGHSETPLGTLVHHLSQKTLLIVLDNCEHLIGAAAQLCEAVLVGTSGVKILATSREALCCSGEWTFDVPPLEAPRDAAALPETLQAMSAVELFTERCKESDARLQMDGDDFAVAGRICRRVDGLPLAIEMVASWAGVLGLKTLEAKLESPSDPWLRAGTAAPPRHATIRGTLEWSFNLLGRPEQIVLRRLAAFAGGFALADAEAVAGFGEIQKKRVFEFLGDVVRKSMVALEPETRSRRYRLLQTTRDCMLEKLTASGESSTVRRGHAHHVLQLLETGIAEWESISDGEWLERYGPLLDDVRCALHWAMTEDPECAVALAGASWPLWRQLSLLVEGRKQLSEAIAHLGSGTSPRLEARLRFGLGELSLNPATAKSAYRELSRAAVLYRALDQFSSLGGVLSRLAFASLMLDRMEEADAASAEALELLEGACLLRTYASACSIRLCVDARRGCFEAARSVGEKAQRLCRLAGAERSGLVVAVNLVELRLEMGDFEDAIEEGRRAAQKLRGTAHTALLAYVLFVIVAALAGRGASEEALIAAREAAPALRDEGMLPRLFDHLALCAGLAGRNTDASLLVGYTDAAYRKSGCPRAPIECRAMVELRCLIEPNLSGIEITRLEREGALLTETQALELALRA